MSDDRKVITETKKILIVDDEPDIVKITKFRLERAGFNVISAPDGTSGLHAASIEKPDLIFLDLGLPDSDGGEICRRIKADDNLKHIPVIILSASTDKARNMYKRIGADDHLLKPYEAEVLIGIAHKYLG